METLEVRHRNEWRDWLSQNHASRPEIWLVYFKKGSGRESIGYGESVEEALCFGWVDGLIRRIDEKRYVRRFTPRKDKSRWSASNRKRVERLIEAGRMTAVGQANVDAAKASGRWLEADRPVLPNEPPPELARELAKNPRAREVFDRLAPSHRKQYIGWVATAKREATRLRRARESVALLERGEKLGMK